MKNVLLIALLIPLTLTNVHAQVAFGFKTGANFGTANTTGLLSQATPDFKFAAGWTAGAVTEINFGRFFALQPEFNWVQKGFTWNESAGIPIGNVEIPLGAAATFRTNNIELPILAKLKLGNETVQGYLSLGPSIGYALNAKIITRPRLFFEFDPIRTKVDLEDINYERFEVSAIGGAGVQFNLNGVKIFADARYVHGFTELYDFPVFNEKIRNHGVSLSAGILFDLHQSKPQKAPARRPILRH